MLINSAGEKNHGPTGSRRDDPGPGLLHGSMTLDQVAKLMCQNDCGEIPVIDASDHLVGVITDRDIVCRVVAEGKNPIGHIAENYMTQPVISVRTDSPLKDVLATMEKIRFGACRSLTKRAAARASSPRPISRGWAPKSRLRNSCARSPGKPAQRRADAGSRKPEAGLNRTSYRPRRGRRSTAPSRPSAAGTPSSAPDDAPSG